jgi:nucleotide-binding universal stress UspA family protein
MSPPTTVFDRVICGIDGSPGSRAAARQAARLLAPGGALTLVTVTDPGARGLGLEVFEAYEARAAEVLAAAARDVAGAAPTERLVEGEVVPRLLEEADSARATLLAVGAHGLGRIAGALLGRVSTRLAHRAPGAVLLARPSAEPERFPASAVVAIDPSDPSEAALAVADDLRTRLSVAVRTVAGVGYERTEDLQALRDRHPDIELVPELPAEAVIDTARGADLVVVGSRGVHGLAALGSVSERVAHRAPCSVLVVRSEPGPA